MTLSAMFVALGVLFPMLFHGVGLGSIFLPMFWPVAAAGFFVPIPMALAVAVITPLISSLFTGMPPISPPIMQIMVLQLAGLAVTIGLLHRNTSFSLFVSLLAGLVVSQVILFVLVIPLAALLGLPPRLASISIVLKGLPGIASMLIALPLLLSRLLKQSPFSWRKRHVEGA